VLSLLFPSLIGRAHLADFLVAQFRALVAFADAVAEVISLHHFNTSNAKLTDDAVKAIRKTVKVREALLKKIRAERGNEALAKKHGVNVSTINKYIGNRLRIQRDGEDVV